MLETLNGYTLDKLPPDALIQWDFTKKELPEVVGYTNVEQALGDTNGDLINKAILLRLNLKKELLGDGFYYPLPYQERESGKVVLVHCDYTLIIEQFYANIAEPLDFTSDTLNLFVEKYNAYIGTRQERQQAEKLEKHLLGISALTGKSVDELRKKIK